MEAVAEKTRKKRKKVYKSIEEGPSELSVSQESSTSKLKDTLTTTEENLKRPEFADEAIQRHEISSTKDANEISKDQKTTSENADNTIPETTVATETSVVEIFDPTVESAKSESENLKSTVVEIPKQPDGLLPKNKAVHVVTDAPSSLDKYLNMNKQILQTLEDIDSIPAQVSSLSKNLSEQTISQSFEEVEEIDIKPYTEQQLSALYYNNELDMLEEFTNSYVEAELKFLPVKQHCLYDLLVNYLKVREKITGNNLEIEQLRREYRDLQNELWTMEVASVTGRAECQDGQIVSASHNYNRSIFHRSVFQNIVRILGNIQKLLYENHILYSYSAEDLRLQIELYLQSVILNAITVTQITGNAPISLSMQAEPANLKPYISEIRLSISVLFAFQRKLIRDVQFLKETREWLTQLVAVLLRVANYHDHLFLISHILRCPAGVGTWASLFVQVPLSIQSTEQVFVNYQINHLLSVLAVILSPVRERDKFLKDIAQSQDVASEALWVLIDSDGEEDEENTGTSLKENDLVALLNQLPLDDLFRCILVIRRGDNKDYYNAHLITEHHLLRFFSFCTVLLRLLHSGLQTYGQPRYNQFSKRLSRLIRHVVQYATDQWEEFLKVKQRTDQAMIQRLQIEYDAFFLRAIFYLYSSQKLGAWQFLAVVPYNMVTINTIWKIFYFLHNSDKQANDILNPLVNEDFSKKLWEKELRIQFEEKLDKLEVAEVYYLLNTFANMALVRGEMDFIYSATMDLLQVGYISKATQETCSKSSRILLSHITSKHPHLLSNILKTVKDNMDQIGGLALNLYEEIPLSIWIITDEDLAIIGGLLLTHPFNSEPTKLARMILSRLNWDLLSYEKHCETAILVVKAVDQEPAYLQWGWQTILRLKLHISDKHFKEFGRVQELERYDILSKGIRENQPLTSFLAVVMTTWGHLVPLICNKGLSQLLLLQAHQKHEAVLFALYQIMPIFINSQECIINCEKFQEILINLLNADRGYVSYAKSFIMTQNTVLQQFGNMIETQIVNYAYYNLQSPRLLVRLWMNSLVSIQNWNKDNGILYLLDVVIRTAFFHKDSLEVIYDNLRELYKCGTPQDSGSIISIFKWVSSGNNTANSLLSSSLASYPWLAYIFLEIEHQERELSSGLWKDILIELAKQKGKISVDNAIKKACSNIKITPFSSGWLCIYRWAQQALDTPVNHPLLPLLWQKLFTLFLARLPTTSAADKVCVGERFFEGIVNFTFLKKIKKRLQETLDYYRNQSDVSEEDSNVDRKNFYKSCHKIYQAFLLWLEEPRLQEGNLLLHDLPTQYESKLLALIIEENSNIPWYEYLDYEQIKRDQMASIKLWRMANFREKTNVNQPLRNPGGTVESSDPVERILRRLTSYDAPKKPPEVKHKAPMIPQIDFSNKETMFKSLEPCFKTLKQFAHNHTMKVSEHKALDCSYHELIPQLYRSVLNKVKKKVPCKGKNQTVYCSGAAVIVLEMQEARVNERIEHQIQANRNAYESLVEKSLQSPAVSLYTSSVMIQQCIRMLQQQIKCNPATAELGVELFYYILSLLNEENTAYPPTKTLLASCLEKLGQSHICGVEYEMPRLLQWILKEPHLGGYIAPHFSPSDVGTSNMLLMYSTISVEMGKKYDIRFALLSKFEIEKWLEKKNPKLSQRSQFLGDVIKALCNFGYDPPIEALMLHGLYRKHLLTVFEFQFPEHYGEVLMHLLKASSGNPETNLVSISVWIDILNSLSQPATIHPKAPLREQLRQYSQHQKVLSHQELLDTADLLARHFTQERLNYGLYGLYPKCRNYIDIYVLLLGMAGHGIILSMLNTHQGLLGDKLCEKIWPYLREMFAPWLIPYSMQTLKDNMAAWIQQLADDRSILLPWIPSDAIFAQKIITVFYECVIFVMHTLPASTSILSYLWQWYVTSYAHPSVKEHILVPIHQAFSAFPWHNFWPSAIDLEFMVKVVDQYLPECHSFLGHVFISVPWSNWINNFFTAPLQIKSRVYHCFLNLLVKLSNEPNIRKNHPEKAKSLLVQAENFDWSALEPVVFQHVIDWVVMSCDSGVIFKSDPLDLDYRLLHLLKTISGFNMVWSNMPSNIIKKRLIYVKANIKLLSVYVSRYKNVISYKQSDIHNVILGYLNELETVVSTEEEIDVLLRELNGIINITEVTDIAVRAYLKWVQNKPSDGLIIKSLLKTLGATVNDLEYLAELYEETLTSYFSNVVNEESNLPTWSEASQLVLITAARQTELEQTLINKSSVLTLNAILLQKVNKCVNTEVLLNSCIDWMTNIKISEQIESKIPLIWFSTINLALKHCNEDEATSGALLYKFSQVLLQISEDRGGNKWGRGLLTAIGLTKQGAVSLKALAGYILAQLPEMKGQPQAVRRVENAPSRVGQSGGNSECPKVLLMLDFGQSQGKIKDCAELALNKIQDPANSLHNAKAFLWLLLKQFYIKPYLRDLG